ncbi:MAG: hypothetical protein LBD86_06680 [Spirochaetaceae bacterium]|jgi:hypothetical protein|nr:hypothetical protein [Spirochaetaceae bacterium]
MGGGGAFAFTEQGIAMLSVLLNSDIAVNVNIQIMRAFVELRRHLFDVPDHEMQIAALLNFRPSLSLIFQSYHE